MIKKRKLNQNIYVNHPRYGKKPIYSGNHVTEEEIRKGFWRYHKESLFPESVLFADIKKQNYSVFPRKYYVDIEKQCFQCKRFFLFFAWEQKYWYETLQFYIDADCVNCIDCRKNEQGFKKMIQRYEVLLEKEHKSDNEASELKYIALELFQLGYIRNKHKIDSI